MPLPKPADAPVLSQFSLKGKVAAVTGGARGIGLEVSRALAEAGASVAMIYSTSSKAPELARQMATELDVRVEAYQADVRSQEDVARAVNKIKADFGKLDIVVANAGIATHVSSLDMRAEQWSDLMKVNLDGVFWTAQAAGRIFEAQGSGNFIVTASVSALLVNLPQKQAAYNASKAAVVQLARCLAVEWADFARVNCVSPGFISTDMIDDLPDEWKSKWMDMVPVKRFCDPHELKGVYVFLASDASSYMTGANLVVDGAYTLP